MVMMEEQILKIISERNNYPLEKVREIYKQELSYEKTIIRVIKEKNGSK